MDTLGTERQGSPARVARGPSHTTHSLRARAAATHSRRARTQSPPFALSWRQVTLPLGPGPRSVQCLTPATLFRSSPAHRGPPLAPTQVPIGRVSEEAGRGMAHAEKGKIEGRSWHGHVLRAGNPTARPAGVLDLRGTVAWEAALLLAR